MLPQARDSSLCQKPARQQGLDSALALPHVRASDTHANLKLET